MEWLLVAAGLALAFANGANDNLKGVATLYGAAQLGYRSALVLATVSQLLKQKHGHNQSDSVSYLFDAQMSGDIIDIAIPLNHKHASWQPVERTE